MAMSTKIMTSSWWGPQVRYKLEDIRKDTGLPADVVNSLDYATQIARTL